MAYPSWQSSRTQFRYRRRTPEQTALYRLVHHYKAQLVERWDELFLPTYGILRDEVVDAFEKYLSCGMLRHGAARARCEHCNHSILVAFSCKRRGLCTSCQSKRAVLFAENLQQHVLLPYPHRHIIFSLPKRLRSYFRYDRALFGELFAAAWQSWQRYVSEQLTGNTAAVLSLHTAGELFHWHPHIHGFFLNGAISEDEQFTKLPEVRNTHLQQLFTDNVFAFLKERELLTQETVDTISAQEHTGFNVYAAEPILADDEDARLFIARYLKKAPLSESRLSIDETGFEPTVVYTKELDDVVETREFSPLQFLAELSAHIPRVFEQTTRFFGRYSCRARGVVKRKERFKLLLEQNFEPLSERDAEKRPASSSWAACMKRVFEIDPLECEKCGSQMKIVAFLQNPIEIDKIAANLGYATARDPPSFGPQGVWVDWSPEFSQL